MQTQMTGHVYPPYRLKPDRELARKLRTALAWDEDDVVPATYLIFLRGERLGVDLFDDIAIPRQKALLGGQRYEWFAPVSFDDELSVRATVGTVTEKQGKRGTISFVNVTYEYRRVRDGQLVVREVTRLIEQP